MLKKSSFLNKFYVIIYLISSFLFAYYIDYSMIDDGLRHISFALNQDTMHSWGEVFPNSLFTSYDPWKRWHEFIRLLNYFIEIKYIHIVINFLSLSILMVLIHKFIKEYIVYKLDSLIYLLVLILTLMTSYRYIMVRPDLISGFYIMILLLSKRDNFLIPFILTLFYGPFYYLFFMYTGSMGLVYMLEKKWRSFFGVFIASVLVLGFFLIENMHGYIDTVLNVLNDQNLREGLNVGEGEPIFSFLSSFDYKLLFCIFFFIVSYLLYKYYSYFKNNRLALFLLITSLLWINQFRYFHLFLPIIYVYLLSIIFNTNKKRFFYKLRKSQVILKKYVSYSKNKKLFYFIAIPYTIVICTYYFNQNSVDEVITKNQFFKNQIYNNKIIVSNSMNSEMYSALYYNPSIKVIPSCGLGWFNYNNDSKYKKLYIKMLDSVGLNEEELKDFLITVKADFYFHYFDKSDMVLNFDKLKKIGLIPIEIRKNKIIFKVLK